MNPLSSCPSFLPQHRIYPSVLTAQVKIDPVLTDWYNASLRSTRSSEPHAVPASEASAHTAIAKNKLLITALPQATDRAVYRADRGRPQDTST